MMNDTETRKEIRMAEISLDQDKRNASLKGIRDEIQKKEIHIRPSWLETVRVQLQYISWGYWLGQLLAVLFCGLIFYNMGVLKEETGSYLLWFSIASALMGAAGVAELGRHFSCGTAEVELSCFLNLSQMWVIKMILFGAVDLVILSGAAMGVSVCTDSAFYMIGIYILVPFVLSNLCYLFLLTSFRKSSRRYVQLGAAFASGLGAALPSAYPKAYHINYFWIWITVLGVGIVLFAATAVRIFRKLREGEVICWS